MEGYVDMVTKPKPEKDENKLISIDPGVNFCGISVIDTSKDTFKVLETLLVNNNRKLPPEYRNLETTLDSRTAKIVRICDIVRKYLEKYGAEKVVIESPFYNALTPPAFSSLLEVINTVKYLAVYPKRVSVTMVDPKTVKMMFTTKGNANKELMRETLADKISKKEVLMDIDLEGISEHEVDAIAIAYTYKLMRPNKGK